jgi:hypothetical protein
VTGNPYTLDSYRPNQIRQPCEIPDDTFRTHTGKLLPFCSRWILQFSRSFAFPTILPPRLRLRKMYQGLGRISRDIIDGGSLSAKIFCGRWMDPWSKSLAPRFVCRMKDPFHSFTEGCGGIIKKSELPTRFLCTPSLPARLMAPQDENILIAKKCILSYLISQISTCKQYHRFFGCKVNSGWEKCCFSMGL